MKASAATLAFVLASAVWYLAHTLWLPGVPCAMRFLSDIMCAGAAIILFSALSLLPQRVRDIAVGGLIVCAGIYETLYGIGQLSGIISSGHSRYALTGTFPNPGPYGGFMAVCASVGLCLYNRYRDTAWIKVVSVIFCAMTIASGSRAAVLALALVAAIQWSALIKKHLVWVLAAVCAISAALYLLKAGSAHGRLFMALMSVEAWKDAFLTGHGLNSCLYALSQAEIDWFYEHPDSNLAEWAGVAEYAFCEPLRIAVEFGLVGIVLFSGTLISALVSLWRRSASFYGLFALAVFSLFSYPFSLWPFCLAFGAFVAEACTPLQPVSKAKTAIAGIAGIAATAISLYTMRGYRDAREEYAYFASVRGDAFTDDYYRLLPWMEENPHFLFAFGKMLRDASRYNESNEMLRRCMSVCNDPMARVLAGRNYEDLGRYDMAEEAYLQAHHMQPRRMYPLYRCMKMYQGINDSAKSVEYAEKIRAIKVKVESPATREMIREADTVIAGTR